MNREETKKRVSRESRSKWKSIKWYVALLIGLGFLGAFAIYIFGTKVYQDLAHLRVSPVNCCIELLTGDSSYFGWIMHSLLSMIAVLRGAVVGTRDRRVLLLVVVWLMYFGWMMVCHFDIISFLSASISFSVSFLLASWCVVASIPTFDPPSNSGVRDRCFSLLMICCAIPIVLLFGLFFFVALGIFLSLLSLWALSPVTAGDWKRLGFFLGHFILAPLLSTICYALSAIAFRNKT